MGDTGPEFPISIRWKIAKIKPGRSKRRSRFAGCRFCRDSRCHYASATDRLGKGRSNPTATGSKIIFKIIYFILQIFVDAALLN
jgi:hypothetical protein